MLVFVLPKYTAALLLCEEVDVESVQLMFQKAYERVSCSGNKLLQIQTISNNKAVHFRSLNSIFQSEGDGHDNLLEFYNLHANGRSPSPAFLLDSLRSVIIDPRGFGGSSGFGRGQWIEPRRAPMPARTVVFIAGDGASPKYGRVEVGKEQISHVKDRCAAARAAGCRVIFLDQLPNQTDTQRNTIDMPTMALCDAVIDTYGNDNPRDLQPITLDAIATPGDYWLNPPSPRDDLGNAVVVDDVVEWFCSERELFRPGSKNAKVVEDKGMSEEEMKAILAELDELA